MFACLVCVGNQVAPQVNASTSSLNAAQDSDTLIYADFENVKEGRAYSNRGGMILLTSYQANEANPCRFKGLDKASPPAPEIVRLKKDDPNRAAAFDYEFRMPNQYAGVAIEVQGNESKDGKPIADDVTPYKYISIQIYVTGVNYMRLELMSRGNGIGLQWGFPQASFKVNPGFNTYKLPLKTFVQPAYVETKLDPKEVLKKLTAVSLTAFCDNCLATTGTVVVDNLMFQKN
jgi:hypothetical protein